MARIYYTQAPDSSEYPESTRIVLQNALLRNYNNQPKPFAFKGDLEITDNQEHRVKGGNTL
jgi:hypothetical protein